MEPIAITVNKEDEGSRLDAFLSRSIEEVTRSYLQKLIEEGRVSIDGAVCFNKNNKVKTGQEILADIPIPESIEARPENIPLDIRYEDEDVVVVNKPCGMVVHPAAGNDSGTLVNALLYHCSDLSGINGMIRPGIVHRIDKDTTGLLVAAKNDLAHAALAEQFKTHSIARVYQAIVHGVVKQEEGVIEAPIGRHPKDRTRQAIVRSGGRDACTRFKVLERFDRFTYIEARLETGRTHQIRVHMASIHHPLAGDFIYGPQKKVYGMDTQLLHAGLIGFIHPRTGSYMEFKAELPMEFLQVLDKLRH